MLKIEGLHVNVKETSILKGLSLEVKEREIHAIMGPNGTGKSSLARVIVGDPNYKVIKGTIVFCGKDLLTLSIEERAHLGLFMGFQHPVEIPGVINVHFLHSVFNAKRKSMGLDVLNQKKFRSLLAQKMQEMQMPLHLVERGVNSGLSGGEKKWNEALQMAILEPKLAILDEPDSGLDIDAIRSMSHTINKQRNSGNALILITHYQRLLNYITPQFVHVIIDGKIIKSGGADLALTLEKQGYESFL